LKVLLDTNAYSDFRAKGNWKEALATASEVLIPLIVVGELKYGFALGNREGINLRKLREFLAAPRVSMITLTESTTSIFAQFHCHLRQQGNPIPTNDIWIAALAYEHEAVLCTRDRHFEFLPQVDVVYQD
jgi:tRNA(fMet)-specific endonuclease VapC